VFRYVGSRENSIFWVYRIQVRHAWCPCLLAGSGALAFAVCGEVTCCVCTITCALLRVRASDWSGVQLLARVAVQDTLGYGDDLVCCGSWRDGNATPLPSLLPSRWLLLCCVGA
jgi:hypothetical protein